MSRSDQVYLKDILQSVELIEQYTQDKTEQDFVVDNLLQDAVIRRFEIIGEAAVKISESIKFQYPEIEWQLMKAMRNKLIHEYFGVSPKTVYRTIQNDLPLLKEHLVKIVGDNF